MQERYLSLAEACEVLDKSERTLYRWIKSGKLKAYKPGRDYEIPESAIQEMRERSEVHPKGQAPLPFDEQSGGPGASFKGSVTVWIRHLEESVDYFAGQLDRDDLGMEGISKISALTMGLMELCHVFEGDVYAEADSELLARYEKAARFLVFDLDDAVIERYDREISAAKETRAGEVSSFEEWKSNRRRKAEPVREGLQRSA